MTDQYPLAFKRYRHLWEAAEASHTRFRDIGVVMVTIKGCHSTSVLMSWAASAEALQGHRVYPQRRSSVTFTRFLPGPRVSRYSLRALIKAFLAPGVRFQANRRGEAS